MNNYEIVGIVVENNELDEPYCYGEWDEESGYWIGIGPFDPEKIIPGEVILTPEGYVYTYEDGIIGDCPIDEEQEWEDWEWMVGDRHYPSARIIT